METVRDIREIKSLRYRGLINQVREEVRQFGLSGSMEEAVKLALCPGEELRVDENGEVKKALGKAMLALAQLVMGDIQVPIAHTTQQELYQTPGVFAFCENTNTGELDLELPKMDNNAALAFAIAYPGTLIFGGRGR